MYNKHIHTQTIRHHHHDYIKKTSITMHASIVLSLYVVVTAYKHCWLCAYLIVIPLIPFVRS